MGLTSFQVCMDSSDWFQGTIQDQETGLIDSSISSPSGITDPMLAACSRPLMERRLRPQHDQALKCPRCDSTHTKFCYYNNYSLTQPRYFCKTCRRYWTKGGTLRNIPVGGGCRKNKKVSSSGSKKSNSANTGNNNSNDNAILHHNPHLINPNPNPNPNGHHHPLIMSSTDLQLSYPESFSASNLFGMGSSSNISNIPSFMFENLNNSATRAIDFMENGGGGGGGGGGNQFMGMMGNGGYAAEMGGGNVLTPVNYHHGGNLCSPFGGMTLDSINNGFMERGLINVYDHQENDHDHNVNDDTISGGMLDVKPKILALEWQDQSGYSSDHHHRGGSGGGGGSSGGGANGGGGGGYLTGLGSSWGGLMNGYGVGPSSTTNPLV